MASGFAPLTARSLQVPKIDSLPMSPPGKKGGSTTYPSVVMRMSEPFSTGPASRSSGKESLLNSGWISCSTRSRERAPPLPCSSRTSPLVFHRVLP